MAVDVPGGILKQSDVRETITNTEETNVGWDLDFARYERKFTSSGAFGLYISPDGKNMYTTNGGGSLIYQYLLSGAWDLSTISFVRSLDITAKETAVYTVFFRPDGFKMYTLGNTGKSVDEYDLTTAWDISSATYLQEFDISGKDTAPRSLFMREDGNTGFLD